VLVLREACLAATEETGRQLWGPARYAAYRTALDAPAAMAASMLEPGVVRFGLGPLTEVVAQRHTFDDLAPHLDATLLPVVAQERVLRGEDLRDDLRAHGEPDDPPLVLQPFEPDYVLPEYRAAERLDGALPDPAEDPEADWHVLSCDGAGTSDTGTPNTGGSVDRLLRALEDVVAPWTAQSGGEVQMAAVRGSATQASCAVIGADAGAVRCGEIDVATLLGVLAFAGASGGVHGRRRGGAAGRALAWWVARCATGLDRETTVEPEELEFRLEDLERLAFRIPGEATWRLELALATRSSQDANGQEWAVGIAAFDRSTPETHQEGADPAPW
jgi:hypothetical protein